MVQNLAFYGDSIGDEVFAIDIDQMVLLARIPTGPGPYPVDRVSENKLLAITRLTSSVTPIDLPTLKALPPVQLTHRPRSAHGNGNGLAVVSGADRSLSTVIHLPSMTPMLTMGSGDAGRVEDFGGLLACGHERWLPDGRRFFHLDRVRRTIQVYDGVTGNVLWSINSPTSVHHVVQDSGTSSRWFAMCEGGHGTFTPPSVLVIEENGGKFKITGQLFLPVPSKQIHIAGGHHLDVHPDGTHVYVGSNEGSLYVIDKHTMTVVANVKTGMGHGHSIFISGEDGLIAISINHLDQYVSIIDATNHRLLENVRITTTVPTGGKKTQGHTAAALGSCFYVMASLDATFCEIDLNSRKVSRTLLIPKKSPGSEAPIPMQGTFVSL